MRAINRHPWLLIAVILAGSVGLFACDQSRLLDVRSQRTEASTLESTPMDLLVARARRAGALHTEFMRYSFEQLRAEWLETRRPLTRTTTWRVLKKACIDFYRLNGLDVSECNRTDRILRGGPSAAAALDFEAPLASGEPYNQYLSAVEYAGSVAADLQDYLDMLNDIEASAIADPSMYSDTLDLELVLAVTSVAAESAIYADTEVATWGELYDPCHYMIIREEWCPQLVPQVALLRLPAPGPDGPQMSLDAWHDAGWRILGADVGAALGGGLWARAARVFIPNAVAAAASAASVAEAALTIIELF
jgi:hypothetical protein